MRCLNVSQTALLESPPCLWFCVFVAVQVNLLNGPLILFVFAKMAPTTARCARLSHIHPSSTSIPLHTQRIYLDARQC